MYSKYFMKRVIDKEVSLIDLLERLLVVEKGSYQVGRSCYCCFHDNENTPAAKIYNDDRGITLFCFSEQRSYRSSDAYERFVDKPLDSFFDIIWRKLSKEKREFYLANIDSGDSSSLLSDWKPTLDKLSKFKQNKISYEQFLDILLEKVDEDKNEISKV